MKGKDIIVEKMHTVETRKGTITIRRTERQLVLIELINAMDKTLDGAREIRDKCTADKDMWDALTKTIRILRKRIAGFGNEFWEIDKRINPEYHDPASWDRDTIDDLNKYVTKNDIKIINEIFNMQTISQ